MAKRSNTQLVDTVFWAVEHAYSPLKGWGHDYLDAAVKAAAAEEKAHRRLGAALVGAGGLRGRASVQTCARYFVARAVVERLIAYQNGTAKAPADWAEFFQTREDIRLGYAVADEIHQDLARAKPFTKGVDLFDANIEAFSALSYPFER